jgi:hypothetical protein
VLRRVVAVISTMATSASDAATFQELLTVRVCVCTCLAAETQPLRVLACVAGWAQAHSHPGCAVAQKLQRDINCLSDENKMTRKRALVKLKDTVETVKPVALVQVCCSSLQVSKANRPL